MTKELKAGVIGEARYICAPIGLTVREGAIRERGFTLTKVSSVEVDRSAGHTMMPTVVTESKIAVSVYATVELSNAVIDHLLNTNSIGGGVSMTTPDAGASDDEEGEEELLLDESGSTVVLLSVSNAAEIVLESQNESLANSWAVRAVADQSEKNSTVVARMLEKMGECLDFLSSSPNAGIGDIPEIDLDDDEAPLSAKMLAEAQAEKSSKNADERADAVEEFEELTDKMVTAINSVTKKLKPKTISAADLDEEVMNKVLSEVLPEAESKLFLEVIVGE